MTGDSGALAARICTINCRKNGLILGVDAGNRPVRARQELDATRKEELLPQWTSQRELAREVPLHLLNATSAGQESRGRTARQPIQQQHRCRLQRADF
jgi:hypothetical protein